MSGLRVLIGVKRVVDYAVKVRVNSSKSAIDLANVKMSMNPFDEIATEEGQHTQHIRKRGEERGEAFEDVERGGVGGWRKYWHQNESDPLVVERIHSYHCRFLTYMCVYALHM